MSLASTQAAFEKYQIPLYFFAIIAGLVVAFLISGTAQWKEAINPALALMLFVTFLQVPLAKLKNSLTNIRFLIALLVANFIVIPLFIAAMLPLLPSVPLIRIAILFVLLCPCIDYVVTFSHLGKADSMLLLAATPVLLILQMLLLPLYFSLLLGDESARLVSIGPFIQAFIWLIVVPLLLAVGLQASAVKWRKAATAAFVGGALPVPATALVLFIIIAAVTPQMGSALPAVTSVIPIYLAFAIIAPMLGLAVGHLFELEKPATLAVAYSTTTRNSLVILPLALSVPGAIPVIPAVIVTQTLTELLFMLVYIPLLNSILRPD